MILYLLHTYFKLTAYIVKFYILVYQFRTHFLPAVKCCICNIVSNISERKKSRLNNLRLYMCVHYLYIIKIVIVLFQLCLFSYFTKIRIFMRMRKTTMILNFEKLFNFVWLAKCSKYAIFRVLELVKTCKAFLRDNGQTDLTGIVTYRIRCV